MLTSPQPLNQHSFAGCMALTCSWRTWPLALGTLSETAVTCLGPHSQEVAGQGLRCNSSCPRSYGVSLAATPAALGSFQKLLVFIRLRSEVAASLQSDRAGLPSHPVPSELLGFHVCLPLPQPLFPHSQREEAPRALWLL